MAMIRATFHFPQGFLWGTATSAHQVEGGNRGNDWWAWEEAGRINGNERSGEACGWWEGRWREDLDRAADSSQNAHRLSLEWSRIEPEPGKWDQDALDRYREILRGAIHRGLTPMVTLHHFSNPRWLVEQGGWLDPATIDRFVSYVRTAVEALEDLASLWITINEPNVYAYLGYGSDEFPPGAGDLRQQIQVLQNLVHAHAAAYHVIHQIQPEAQVGLAHHYRSMVPAKPGSLFDRQVTRIRSQLFNELVPEAVHSGRFRLPWRSTRIPEAANSQDFFGLNYYTEELISFDVRSAKQAFGRGQYAADHEVSPTGFIASAPGGMRRALRWARGFNLPIYVTENGVEDPSDELRRRYLARHLKEVWHAANLNWRVRGYFHWTLVDNFEWERGWSQRFGLWALDPVTQERSKRMSADFYAQVARENCLSSEMIERYAPEIYDEIYVGPPPDSAEAS